MRSCCAGLPSKANPMIGDVDAAGATGGARKAMLSATGPFIFMPKLMPGNGVAQKPCRLVGELRGGELAALVGVDDLRRAVFRKSLLKRLYSMAALQSQPPGRPVLCGWPSPPPPSDTRSPRAIGMWVVSSAHTWLARFDRVLDTSMASFREGEEAATSNRAPSPSVFP